MNKYSFRIDSNPFIMIGIRLWFSVLLMFAGSAIVSFYQMLNAYKPNVSNADEWLPFENERHSLRDGQRKRSSGSITKKDVVKSHGLFPFNEPKYKSIKSIALLGERNSGTRWIYG